MVKFLSSPVNVINAGAVSSGAWTDITVSDHYAGANAVAGVAVRIANASAATTDNAGIRPNGGTDSVISMSNYTGLLQCGTDTNGIFEVYVADTNMQLWLEGWYTDTESAWNTNFVNQIAQVTSSAAWVDVSISSLTGANTALFASYFHQSTAFTFADTAVRVNGSTDSHNPRAEPRNTYWGFTVGLDSNQIFEMRDLAPSERLLWLTGWVWDNASVLANGTLVGSATTPTYTSTSDYSDSTTWTPVASPVSDTAAAGIFYELSPQNTQSFQGGLRPGGTTFEAYGSDLSVGFQRGISKVNSSFEVEVKVNDERFETWYYGSLFETSTGGAAPATFIYRNLMTMGMGR